MFEVLPASLETGGLSARYGLLAALLHGGLIVVALELTHAPTRPLGTPRSYPIPLSVLEPRARAAPEPPPGTALMPPAPQIAVPLNVPDGLPAPVPTDPARTGTPRTGLEVTEWGAAASGPGGIQAWDLGRLPVVPGGVLTDLVVDDPAAVLEPRRPRYPRALEVAGISGRVIVEFVVDTSGRAEPGSVRIVFSSHTGFDAPARDAVLGTRYRPARFRGASVRQLVRQLISFLADP